MAGTGCPAGNLIGVGLLFATGMIAAWFVREGRRGQVQLWAAYALTMVWDMVGIVATSRATLRLVRWERSWRRSRWPSQRGEGWTDRGGVPARSGGN